MPDFVFKGEKPDHISHSQMEAGKCLYKYLRLRLLADIPNDSAPMQLGKMVHEVIYRYTDWCVRNHTDGDYEEMVRIIDETFSDGQCPEEIYKDARNILLQFGEAELQFDRILDYEKSETITIGKDSLGNDIKLVVILDRANSYRGDNGTVLEIVDYKNQMNILTKSDVDSHDQLNLYLYAACNHLYKGFEYARIGVCHTRYNFTRWGELRKVREMGGEFETIEKYVIRQWERLINSEEYKPSRCGACWTYGGCAVMKAGQCPLWSKKEVEQLKLSVKTEDKVHAFRKMKADLAELGKAIQGHFSESPMATIGGKLVGYQKSVSPSYLVEPWYQYCSELGVNISDITIAKTQAEKAIGRHKKVKDMDEAELKQLEKMQLENVSSKFTI